MQFEKFTQFGRGYRPICSIRTNAQIGFNRGAIHRFELTDGYAVLYYSKESNIVGIQPVDDKSVEGATRLIVKDNNAFVSGKSFLEFYNIPYGGHTQAYAADWSDEHSMILVDLCCPLRRQREEAADEA